MRRGRHLCDAMLRGHEELGHFPEPSGFDGSWTSGLKTVPGEVVAAPDPETSGG